MAKEVATEELKHVLLHELTHLRRRDDWTNLVQKIVKAVLFFNPGVWWMERELSLHREIACDDAVLAHTSSPRTYAECLARVAEKSFLRRQIALAQAAVSRMRQLTFRVARILDPDRATSTKLWKPAVPVVTVLALVSGISVANAPELVRVDDGANLAAVSRLGNAAAPADAVYSAAKTPVADVHAGTAGMKISPAPAAVKANWAAAEQGTAGLKSKRAEATTTQVRARQERRPPKVLESYQEPAGPLPRAVLGEQNAFVLVVETRQTVTAAADGGWQVRVQQVRWLVPVQRIQKAIPGKI